MGEGERELMIELSGLFEPTEEADPVCVSSSSVSSNLWSPTTLRFMPGTRAAP